MGERVEVKNLNSVRSVVRAVDYEAARQIEAAEGGNPQLVHETRTFDVSTGCTTRMRAKESAPDYRFLPDPDLPPLVLEQAFVDAIAAACGCIAICVLPCQVPKILETLHYILKYRRPHPKNHLIFMFCT